MCNGLKHGFHGTKLWTRLGERAAVSQGSFWPTPLISTGNGNKAKLSTIGEAGREQSLRAGRATDS